MDKSKISITISPDLLKWIDSMVKKKVFSSRSHGVEYCITEVKSKIKK